MGKKITNLLSLGVVATSAILLFTACTGKKQGSTGQSKKDSIALITDSNGISDQSFNEAAWAGFKAYGKEHNLQKGSGYQYFESNSATDFTPNFDQAAKSGYDTIYGIGYMLKDAVKAAAKKNPKKNFVIIDDIITKQKNVTSVTFKSNEAAYLAGVAAAYTTKTNKVAFIGGAKAVTLESFASGFKQGVTDAAKALNKKIEVTEQYIGNFTATDKAKSMAQSLYANKYDVIFHAAGSAGNGVFQEAKAYNQMRSASQRVWVVGVDVDQAKLGNYKSKDGQKGNFTLTSVLKRLDVATKSIADQAAKGKFPGGKHLVYSLKDNGVSVTKGSMSPKAWTAVQKAKTQIVSGRVKVK